MSNTPSKPAKPKKQKAGKNKPGISLLAIILALATILGGLVAVLALLPRVSVTSSDPVDPDETFSASFTIANNNFVPLEHVNASIQISALNAGGLTGDTALPRTVPWFSGLFRPEWHDHYLAMDEKFTITPSDLAKGKTADADIAIAVDYNPWFLPWKQRKIFRFKTHRQTDGKLYWYSVPVN